MLSPIALPHEVLGDFYFGLIPMTATGKGNRTKKGKGAVPTPPVTGGSTDNQTDPTLDVEVNVQCSDENTERKVPLWESLGNIQLINEALSDESTEIDPEAVKEFLQQSHDQARSAINRMVKAIQVRQRYIRVRTDEAKALRAAAAKLTGMVRSDERQVDSIKQGILKYFLATGTQKLECDTAKLHLTNNSRVAIDETKVPDLAGILALNQQYPGIIGTLKFDENGGLCDVEWRSKAIAEYIKQGVEFPFAAIETNKSLVLRQGREVGDDSEKDPTVKQVSLL